MTVRSKPRPKPALSPAAKAKLANYVRPLPKTPSGIEGLDEVTGGGLPRGRPTLVCGGAGSGKTLLALEFLVHGALDHGEPGVFIAFEETEEDLIQNVASLGFDLQGLIDRKLVQVDYIHVERNEIEETGEYDLDGLFIRLALAIDAIGAKRVVIDTLEVLFSGFNNPTLLRTELRRLFRWLKERGQTVILTAERGEGTLTRHGLEEYVSDCVILLDNRVVDQISTRRIRVVKYRGSAHGTNEYPFLIDEHGLSVLPITAVGLEHHVPTGRVSSGVRALDVMLGGQGYFRASSILISGTAGTGKSSLAAHFAEAATLRGERTLYFAFEESPNQIQRNMRSIGIDLTRPVQRGLLRFHAVRPTHYGLEMHLAVMHRALRAFQPSIVVIDPITNLLNIGSAPEVRSLLTRLFDYLKTNGITALFTSLTTDGEYLEHTDVGISSLVDSWLMLKVLEGNGERNRGLQVIKSRGMAHSNQLREYRLTAAGLQLVEVFTGPGEMLSGAARAAQREQDQAATLQQAEEIDAYQRAHDRRRLALEAQIAALRAQFEVESEDASRTLDGSAERVQMQANTRAAQSRLRRGVTSAEAPAADNGQPKAKSAAKRKRG